MHDLGFSFAIEDFSRTMGKISIKPVDWIIVLYQCYFPSVCVCVSLCGQEDRGCGKMLTLGEFG